MGYTGNNMYAKAAQLCGANPAHVIAREGSVNPGMHGRSIMHELISVYYMVLILEQAHQGYSIVQGAAPAQFTP